MFLATAAFMVEVCVMIVMHANNPGRKKVRWQQCGLRTLAELCICNSECDLDVEQAMHTCQPKLQDTAFKGPTGISVTD